MSESALVNADEGSRFASSRGTPQLTAMAWRNVRRTSRRTWLAAGGIAFAVFLLTLILSIQIGAFTGAVDNAARIMLGHIQLQHPHYQDDPSIENRVTGIRSIIEDVEARPGVETASARAMSFALTSSGERSYGAQIMGVEYQKESKWSALPAMQLEGRYLAGPGEALIGSALARNLGLAVGDELVILGTAVEGGVAALVSRVVGTYTTGQPDLDRAIVQVPLGDFQAAWNLSADEAHSIIIITDSVTRSEELAPSLSRADLRSLGWRDLQPEIAQTMELKLVGVYVMFVLVAIIVIFSIVNSFMMVIFERTQEFGMLMAVGMRRRDIIMQLQIEAFLVWLLGAAVGLAITGVLLAILIDQGIPLPPQADDLMKLFSMPSRIYPVFEPNGLYALPIMLIGTQIAALIPGLRLLGMKPVEALRPSE